MKLVWLTLALVIAIFVSSAVEPFISPIASAEGARVYLVPVFFCFGACVLPFPCMLLLAVEAGILSDFSILHIVHHATEAIDSDTIQTISSSVEIPSGWSILFYLAFGSICQGVRPLVLRGHWWLPALLSALTTMTHLAIQFVMITMHRFTQDGLFWSETVIWRIVAPGLIASLLTLVLVVIATIAENLFTVGRRPVRDF
ncbi:MAG TPA: hypothetical protein VIM48_06190 [Chthoniobacterales bacterium]